MAKDAAPEPLCRSSWSGCPPAHPSRRLPRAAMATYSSHRMPVAAPVAPPTLPTTKREMQSLMRRLGHTGYKIDAIDGDRVFVLSGPVYQATGRMERRAYTLVFDLQDEHVGITRYEGWVCD